MNNNMRSLKVAIFADAIVNRGGGERIILEQAKHFNADIYTIRYISEKTFSDFKTLKVHLLSKFNQIGYSKILGKIFTLYSWYIFSTLKLKKKYDVYIFHFAGSLNAAKNFYPNVWYCHSPSRYIYDMYNEELNKHKDILKLFYPLTTKFMRFIDQKNVGYIDKILVNSKNVQNRVKRFYGRESKVVYPFVDIKKVKYITQKKYYLSAARLDRIKRIDLIIKAFKKMPDKKLVVVSDGPEKKRLKKLANNCLNITFLGYIDEEKLMKLYGECIATIYLSYKEDFGMVPIEGMAAGKPCIATNEGG
ncbi:glycosyltransferase, partial [archaeon]|nr:glycosyltransferase [archaeon]